MARPIKPTPILSDEQAEDFHKRVDAAFCEPLKTLSAPSLAKAKQVAFAKKHAVKQ